MKKQSNPPTATLETITPDVAAKYLALTKNVRHRSEARCANLSRAMKDGLWHVNGQSIKFNCDGFCIDGQHRLRACIIAGVPFSTFVVRNVVEVSEIDTGSIRTGGQLLQAIGFQAPILLAAAARALWYYLGPGLRCYGSNTRPSHAEIMSIATQHPRLSDSVAASSLRQRMISPATLGFIHYIGRHGHQALADEFVEQVQLGEVLAQGDPAYALRERMIRARKSHGCYPKVRVIVGWACEAWNAAAAKEKLKTIHWCEGDEYPELLGMPRS